MTSRWFKGGPRAEWLDTVVMLEVRPTKTVVHHRDGRIQPRILHPTPDDIRINIGNGNWVEVDGPSENKPETAPEVVW